MTEAASPEGPAPRENALVNHGVGTGGYTVWGYIGGFEITLVPHGTYTIQSVATTPWVLR